MNNEYKIETSKILMEYLVDDLKINRKKVKAILTNKSVLVNNKVITQYNHLLKKNDVVLINKSTESEFDIVYEDKNIIVIVKPAGLLTIGTDNEKEKTLYHMVSSYMKKTNKNSKVFVIHRLDKDTSGIVMFAKDEKTKKAYQDNWDELVKARKYIAVVEGITDEAGKITSYLQESETFRVFSTKDRTGKLAITNYKKIKSNKEYTLLDIDIETGRKNQIRVHMSDINHPIVSDKKYGSTKNPLHRLGLHAYKLELINPLNKKLMVFETAIPGSFKKATK